MNIKEIALEILHKYEEAEGSVLNDHGGLYDEDYLCQEVEKYKEQIENAIIDTKTHWTPITKRPMDNEERKYFEEILGCELEDEDAFIYKNLPEDGEEVIICTSYGTVTTDVFDMDDGGVYFESYDIECVVAWMSMPKPYEEAEKEE